MDKNQKDPELEHIKKHLKAEAKIQETHELLDELLDSDGAPIDKDPVISWKKMAGLLLLLLFAGGLWFWQKNTPQQKETILPKVAPTETQQTTPPPLEEQLKTPTNTPSPKVEQPTKKIQSNNNKNTTPIAIEPSKDKAPPTNTKNLPSTIEEPTEINLIASTFTPIDWGTNTTRSLSKTAPADQKLIAKQKYKAGDFKATAALLTALIQSYPNDWELHFFKGTCDFKTQQYQLASQAFTQIIDNDNNLFIEDAEWFLVGTLLAKEEQEQAVNILEQKILIYPAHKYHKVAKKLVALIED